MASLATESTLVEPNRPRIVRQEIFLRRWPARLEGFKIALLSDFHYEPYFSVHPLRASIGMVKDLHPDLIVLTGDFVSEPFLHRNHVHAASAAGPCAQLLRQMQAPFGLWAVLGNHDIVTDPNVVADAVRGQGIRVLINQSVPIEGNGGRFWLGGVNDALERKADLQATLQGIPADECMVLLAHEPDYADHVARYPVDLQLSGHTHGGQVRLPFIGATYLPPMGRKYVSGLYKMRGLTLYTNRGLGTVNLPVRMNCPPEITFLTLRPSVTA